MTTFYMTKWNHEVTEIEGVADGEAVRPDKCHGLASWATFRLGKDVFATEAEAKQDVVKRIRKRKASLEKQIQKLDKMLVDLK